MEELLVRKAPLPWWAAGLLLGMAQVLAVGLKEPLGVSTQFVVADTQLLQKTHPQYVNQHPLIKSASYRQPGYGWWFDIGLIAGAFVAAALSGRWRLRVSTLWWQANRGPAVGKRLLTAFVGGVLILLGARFAHGCTSGQFASGWAQLSLSAVPFTLTLFLFGMVTARLVYPKAPGIEK